MKNSAILNGVTDAENGAAPGAGNVAHVVDIQALRIAQSLGRTGRLDRAIYVERGTMAGAVTMPLTAKTDDDAPYFAVVLVPGWGGRP